MFICVEYVEESQVDGRVIVLSNFTSRVHVREVLLYKYGQREIFFKKRVICLSLREVVDKKNACIKKLNTT